MDASRRQRTQTKATAEEQALDQIARELRCNFACRSLRQNRGVSLLGGRLEGRKAPGGAPASTTATRRPASARERRPMLHPRVISVTMVRLGLAMVTGVAPALVSWWRGQGPLLPPPLELPSPCSEKFPKWPPKRSPSLCASHLVPAPATPLSLSIPFDFQTVIVLSFCRVSSRGGHPPHYFFACMRLAATVAS
ncbi:unnamed protein product [Chilo suppressalis]|uniref:Uncharacterized protein n=1 Tax=Chilo suppressalis TaxID=168631 RepID=A0ABN8BCZ4_CHISP|nr:unnamed protein product [Chilo suppressalis]